MAKDFYQTLGISRTATEKEIKSSYRKLARQFHPDVNPTDKSAEAKFKAISEAFQTLSDPDKRKLYDQFGDNYDKIPPGYTGGPGNGPGNGRGVPPGYGGGMPPDLEELFRQAGRGGGANFPGGSVNVPGGRPDFRTPGQPGSGGDTSNIGDLFGEVFGMKGGKGFGFGRKRGPQKGQDVEQSLEITLAESVRGTQRHLELVIRDNDSGTGEKRNFTVKIPAGVGDGAVVKVSSQGGSGESGGARGDLFLKLRIAPDKFWKREGNDIKIEVPVTFAEAALGAQIHVPTLTGEITLKLPAGTQSGQTIRLTGRGVKNQKTGATGDQYVTAKVAVPKNLAERETELIHELEALRTEDVRAGIPKSL